MAKAENKAFKFVNPDVADKFVVVGIQYAKDDPRIRVPQAKWPPRGDQGYLSTITVEVAEQLIAEGYNLIARKP